MTPNRHQIKRGVWSALFVLCMCVSCGMPFSPVPSMTLKPSPALPAEPSPATVPGSSDPTGDDEWPMFGGQLNQTRRSTTVPVEGSDLKWSYNIGHEVQSSPAVADGCVYVGSHDNKTYCLDARTGAFIWSYTTGHYVQSSPAVADGRVYVASFDWYLYCLDGTTGGLIWKYNVSNYEWPYASPAVAGGRVYLATLYQGLYCLNATTGQSLWNATWIGTDTCPAVVGGLLYIAGGGNTFYCLNAITGAQVWNFTFSGRPVSSPAVAYGYVYVGSSNNQVCCLDAATGASVWNLTTGYEVYSSPAVADGRVYVGEYGSGSPFKSFYCLNAYTGAVIWSYSSISYGISSAAAIAGGHVYVASRYGMLYSFNATTGTLEWTYRQYSGDTSSPAIAYGYLYFGWNDNHVKCFPLELVPLVPQNVQVIGGNTQILLTWESPPATSGGFWFPSPIMYYKIYRKMGSGGGLLWYPYATVANTTVGNVFSYLDWNVEPGHVYYYRIRAVNVLGEGVLANAVGDDSFGVPATPRGLQASMSDGHVLLTWIAPENGGSPIFGYKVYRGLTADSEEYYTGVDNVTTYLDPAEADGKTYYYRISAVNSHGESVQSAEARLALETSSDQEPSSDLLEIIAIALAIIAFIVAAIAIIAMLKMKREFKNTKVVR